MQPRSAHSQMKRPRPWLSRCGCAPSLISRKRASLAANRSSRVTGAAYGESALERQDLADGQRLGARLRDVSRERRLQGARAPQRAPGLGRDLQRMRAGAGGKLQPQAPDRDRLARAALEVQFACRLRVDE